MNKRPTPETDAMHAKQGLTHASYRDFARNLERQRDEACEAIVVVYMALLEAHDRSKPENQNGASLFHVHQKAKKALAKIQPFLKP